MTLLRESGSRSPTVVPRLWPFADFLFEPDPPGSVALSPPVDGSKACFHFSGLARIGGVIVASAADLEVLLARGAATLPDLLSATGHFTAVLRIGEELLFLNDLLGLEHFYVYESAAGPIISNRLHLLVERLREKGEARRINLPFAATMLATTHAFFSQVHDHELALAGVFLVPMDRYPVMQAGRLSYRPKPVVAEAFEARGDYESLVDKAAEDIIASIQALRQSGLFDQFAVDLSGGRDSRVVFSAILKLGLLPVTPVDTRHVPGTTDLRNALRIGEHYGASWFAEARDAPPLFPVDAAEALAQWRSYYAGMYHRFYPLAYSTRGADLRLLRLTGACGGAFTAVWSKWVRKQLDSPTREEALAAVFVRLAPDIPAEYRPAALEAFSRTILAVPGESLGEKLDNHYLFFRDRMHFGMRAYSANQSHSTWAPLVSPFLLLASRSLPWPERRDSRVLFDVLARIVPELNFFPYEGRPVPKRFLPRHPPKPWKGVNIAKAKERWKEVQAVRLQGLAARRRSAGSSFSRDGLKANARAVVSDTWPRLAAAIPELEAAVGPGFFDRTLRSFDDTDNDKSWRLATSKITALADLLIEG